MSPLKKRMRDYRKLIMQRLERRSSELEVLLKKNQGILECNTLMHKEVQEASCLERNGYESTLNTVGTHRGISIMIDSGAAEFVGLSPILS